MENKPWEKETVITLINEKRTECGNGIALYINIQKPQVVSYTDLYNSLGVLSGFLMQKYNQSHIAILGENSSEWFIAYLGILCSGCVAVPIEKELSVSDILKRLEYSDCKAVFLSEDYMDYRALIEERGMEVLSLSRVGDMVEAVIKEGKTSDILLSCSLDLDSPAVILFTSGTSGEPKAVVLSHKGLVSNAYGCAIRNPKTANIAVMELLPLHHALSLTAAFSGMLVETMTMHFTSLRTIMNDIIRLKPGIIIAVPAIIEMIYDNVKNISDKQIREIFGEDPACIISGGTYLSGALQEEMSKKGIQVVQGYGMTECSPIIAMDELKNGLHIGSVGRAVDCCTVLVNEPDENGVGELVVRGDNLMLGYYKNIEATKQIIKDGMLYTGDMGYIDDEGYIYITGRKKNLIILSNGKNVSPEELERKFDNFSYIREVCVYENNGIITGEFFLDKDKYPDAEELLKKDVLLVNRSLPKYKNIVKIVIRNKPFEHNKKMRVEGI